MGGARKIGLAVLALACTLGVSACSEVRVTKGTYAGGGGAEAPYLNVGPLIYEVQISRAMNPYLREDEPYFEGMTEKEREPEAGEEWFGVFVQVYNHHDAYERSAQKITIEDTQGNKYTPVKLASTNLFAYHAGGKVPPEAQVPPLGSIAYEGPTQGALLLYKIALASLDNRPLTITIEDTETKEKATAELDT